MPRRLIAIVLLLASCAAKYYRVPRTEAGVWCLGYCADDYVRCMDGVKRASTNCMNARNACLAGCPGAVEVSEAEFFADDAGT